MNATIVETGQPDNEACYTCDVHSRARFGTWIGLMVTSSGPLWGKTVWYCPSCVVSKNMRHASGE